jgi:hypothetical protein
VNESTNEILDECAKTFFYWVTDTNEVGKSEPLEAVFNSCGASLQLQSYTAVIYFFLVCNACSDTLRNVNASASNKRISQSVDQIRSSINDNDCFTTSLAISKNIAHLLCLLATVFTLTMM